MQVKRDGATGRIADIDLLHVRPRRGSRIRWNSIERDIAGR